MSPPYPERKFAAGPLPNQLVAQCVIAVRQRARAAGDTYVLKVLEGEREMFRELI